MHGENVFNLNENLLGIKCNFYIGFSVSLAVIRFNAGLADYKIFIHNAWKQ